MQESMFYFPTFLEWDLDFTLYNHKVPKILIFIEDYREKAVILDAAILIFWTSNGKFGSSHNSSLEMKMSEEFDNFYTCFDCP